jgi:hypothetical protein
VALIYPFFVENVAGLTSGSVKGARRYDPSPPRRRDRRRHRRPHRGAAARPEFEVDVYEQAPADPYRRRHHANAARILLHRRARGSRERCGRSTISAGTRPALRRAPLSPQCESSTARHVAIQRRSAGGHRGIQAERIHLGLVGLAEREDHVEASFDNGTRITPDILLGADGIHSAVRFIPVR